MVRILVLLLSVFIFACTPQREITQIPPDLDWNNIPKPFKGELYVSSFRIPFKYYPKEDRIVFPITLAGFVYYSNKTLRLGKYKVPLPVELWRILKHRLVKKDCLQTPDGSGYRFFCKGENFNLTLEVNKEWKPIKGEICDQSGCYGFSYKGKVVKIDFLGNELIFLILN
jgi:hypothetical protein